MFRNSMTPLSLDAASVRPNGQSWYTSRQRHSLMRLTSQAKKGVAGKTLELLDSELSVSNRRPLKSFGRRLQQCAGIGP